MGHLSRSRVPSFYCCPLDGWSGNISLESGVGSGGGLVSKNRIGWAATQCLAKRDVLLCGHLSPAVNRDASAERGLI